MRWVKDGIFSGGMFTFDRERERLVDLARRLALGVGLEGAFLQSA